MSECDFHRGDLVQIKTLEQLKSEYYVSINGTIATPGCGFAMGMRPLCGVTFRISNVCKERDFIYFRSEEGIENDDNRPAGFWYITEHMIVPCDQGMDCCQEIDFNEWLALI